MTGGVQIFDPSTDQFAQLHAFALRVGDIEGRAVSYRVPDRTPTERTIRVQVNRAFSSYVVGSLPLTVRVIGDGDPPAATPTPTPTLTPTPPLRPPPPTAATQHAFANCDIHAYQHASANCDIHAYQHTSANSDVHAYQHASANCDIHAYQHASANCDIHAYQHASANCDIHAYQHAPVNCDI